jgi:hypothetical protein
MTNHPGVYERPEEPPRFDLVNLFRVLFGPQQAFRDLYGHTNAVIGLVLAVVFATIGGALSLAISLAVDAGPEVFVGGFFFPGMEAEFAIVSFGLGVLASVGIYLLATYLVYALLKSSRTTLKPNLGKTFGLVGYAKFPALLLGMLSTTVAGALTAGGLWFTAEGVVLIIMLVTFVWALFVHSHAASVANDSSLSSAFGFTFLAWFITFLIMIVVSVMAMFVGIGLFLF